MELAGVKNLPTLSLTNTKITDAGLQELARFKYLITLTLHSLKVTDTILK